MFMFCISAALSIDSINCEDVLVSNWIYRYPFAPTHHIKIVHGHDPFIEILLLIHHDRQLVPHHHSLGFAHDVIENGSVELLLRSRSSGRRR